MPRLPWRILVASALLFLVVLAARFPAAWAKHFLPASVSCRELSGSIWSGECLGLAAWGLEAGDVDWELHPASLLAGGLGGSFILSQPRAHGSADFQARSGGSIEFTNLHARLTLDASLYRALPQNLVGELVVELASLELKQGRIRAIRGRLEAHDVVKQISPPLPLGAWEVRFDSPPQPNGDISGVVRDLGGPVAFDGTLILTQEPGYRLDGRVAARPGADANLARAFQVLGTPDAQGRRPLTVEGTF